ncbi:GTPase [Olleya sp. R77988]|uniref:GTPase n=1 Tax=Olleya sp. R77988 TaxID=3093875 RepID=UPI0037C9C876
MDTLIFVYNANSGIKNLALDIAHKLFSPKTYACNLCALTFNTFSENTIWKDFRNRTTLDIAFLHIDEFETKYPNQTFNYPVILSRNKNSLNVFLSKDEINALSSVEELILTIESKSCNMLR